MSEVPLYLARGGSSKGVLGFPPGPSCVGRAGRRVRWRTPIATEWVREEGAAIDL